MFINRILLSLLPLIVLLSSFCILDPHNRVNEIGVCYKGYEEYQHIVQSGIEHIDVINLNSDTIIIDSLKKDMDFNFLYTIDSTFFRYGNFVLTSILTDTLEVFKCSDPNYLNDSYDGFLFLSIEGSDRRPDLQLGDVKIYLSNKNTEITHTIDTFTISITCKLDTLMDSDYHSEKNTKPVDKLQFKVGFSLKRYMDDCYCSTCGFIKTVPITVVVRRRDE